MAAFQASAFQNNAFQVSAVVAEEIEGGASYVGGGLTEELGVRLPTLPRPGTFNPYAQPSVTEITLPRLRTPHGVRLPDREPDAPPRWELPSDKEELEAKWRAWQARPGKSGTGSILEYICWDYLVNSKKLREDVDFFYQVPFLGGRTRFGGFVADFYIPSKRLVWNPAGLRYHYVSPQDRAKDELSKVILAGRGVKVIFLYEDDLNNRPKYTLDRAWNGEQVSRTRV